MNVLLLPIYKGADKADGGIRRVVEAQVKYLPGMGINLVDSISKADLVATHALEQIEVPVNLPWVMHCHGVYYQEFNWQAQFYHVSNQRLAKLLTQADYITAPSEWIAQTLRRIMLNNPKILMHGVNAEEWEGGLNAGYILWNKARQDAASNPEPLHELARMMPRQNFVSTFSDGLLQNIRTTGALPYEEAKELTRNAGLYLSTAQETFGIGTLEALASGVPVVGWDFGGNSEIIIHKETGWLSRPGDYEDLMHGIEWCLANRSRLSLQCKEDVKRRWTWEEAMQRYVEYYSECLKPHEGPKVSVIIPCYNLGKYLPDAIGSVLDQTMKDTELIIVDDASTDNTEQVVDYYLGQLSLSEGYLKWPIRYLKNEKNYHVSYTRNKGIAQAQGKYILCLDADDKLALNTLEVLSNALDNSRATSLVYGGLKLMTEDGQVRDNTHDWPVQFDFNKQVNNDNCVPTVCMFRKSFFDRTNGFRSRLSPVEDADMWTRLAEIGANPIKVTDEPTFFYRLRRDSISRTMVNPRWDAWHNPNNASFLVDPSKEPKTYLPVKISVIIPVGPKHERIVIDAIDSVYLQTFENWECIVVNDSGNEIPQLPSWVKLLNTELPEQGPAAARNLGIANSSSKLFVCLDADDYLQPNALEELFKAYTKYGGVIYSQWYDQTEKTSVYDPPDYDARLLINKGCIHAVTALYPKDVWEEVGGFDTDMSHWEDWDFQLALADKGVCGTKIPEPLWTYRKLTGFRREDNVNSFEDGKKVMLKKWHKFFIEGSLPMACGGCSRGGGVIKKAAPPATPESMAAMQSTTSAEDMILLEFIGNGGARTYIGSVTKTTYRFGADQDHRVRLVHRSDAVELLKFIGQFREYDRERQLV